MHDLKVLLVDIDFGDERLPYDCVSIESKPFLYMVRIVHVYWQIKCLTNVCYVAVGSDRDPKRH